MGWPARKRTKSRRPGPCKSAWRRRGRTGARRITAGACAVGACWVVELLGVDRRRTAYCVVLLLLEFSCCLFLLLWLLCCLIPPALLARRRFAVGCVLAQPLDPECRMQADPPRSRFCQPAQDARNLQRQQRPHMASFRRKGWGRRGCGMGDWGKRKSTARLEFFPLRPKKSSYGLIGLEILSLYL